MNELLKRIVEFQEKNPQLTLILANEDRLLTSEQKGIKSILKFISFKLDLRGYSAFDKVIGTSSAYLLVGLGIKEVYCKIISLRAKEILKNYHIEYYFDKEVEYIMEDLENKIEDKVDQVANGCKDPVEALRKIQIYLQSIGVQYK